MSKELKCPMCQSTDVGTYKDNPDDKGMCWHTYYECRKCGRTCRDYDWLKLTDYEKETIKTKMLTAEVERMKADNERLKKALEKIADLTFMPRNKDNVLDRTWHIARAALFTMHKVPANTQDTNDGRMKGGEDE